MLNHIITYLNTRLATTGYFTTMFEFVELKPQKDKPVAPMAYCNNEWIDVSNFDKANGTSYIRLRSAISITEKNNTHVSGETLLNISYPLRVVGVVKNSHLLDNNSFRSINLAQDIAMAMTNTGAIQLNTSLKSRSVDILVSSLNVDAVSVMREEMPAVSERYEYTIVAVDINVNVEISQDCYEDTCGNTVTSCSALNAALTQQEKNTCILPTYDFSNDEVFNSLSDTQEDDLTDRLCGAVGDANVQNSTGSYDVDVACSGSLVLPDNTYNLYVGGVLRSTTTGASIEATTINIYLS